LIVVLDFRGLVVVIVGGGKIEVLMTLQFCPVVPARQKHVSTKLMRKQGEPLHTLAFTQFP
jgi:hypothetical protein